MRSSPAAATRIGLWPPFPLQSVHSRPASVPFPLSDPRCRVYSLARQGLWHGVRALGFEVGDEVLVPAYHQGAEIEAFSQAGLKCLFYRVDERLEPVEADLVELAGPRTRGLHIIHYWGFPQNVARWRSWCDERRLFLIEDGAQALLASSGNSSVGSAADLAVFCLYKSFGLPDGAAAICRSDLPAPRSGARIGASGLARRAGSALTARSRMLALVRAALVPEREESRDEGGFLAGEFELGDSHRSPTRLTSRLLQRVIDPVAAERRREHYAFLLGRLRHRVPAPFDVLPDGAVPIAFPLEVDNGLKAAASLRPMGIAAGVLWPTRHPIVPAGQWERADYFRDHVLALPVHQELTAEHLERIAVAASGIPLRAQA